MRRADRAVLGLDGIENIMQKCEVCRLALMGPEYPYIVPLNFGYVREGDIFTLYFHCAKEGLKLDLIRACPRAAFEMDANVRIVEGETANHYTAHYESVMGRGAVEIVKDDQEKRRGLEALMQQIAPGKAFSFSDETLSALEVLKLTVSEITGKRNPNAKNR